MLSFFPLDVLDEIWDLIESVSEGFLTDFYIYAINSTVQITILNKKGNLTGFNFFIISWFLSNPTYHISIFVALVYVHHTHIFSTRLSFQITLYATKTSFLHFCTCAVTH